MVDKIGSILVEQMARMSIRAYTILYDHNS